MIFLQMLLLFENTHLSCHYYNSKLSEVEKISNSEKKKNHEIAATFSAPHSGNIFPSSLNFTHERILLVIRYNTAKENDAPSCITALIHNKVRAEIEEKSI